MGQEVTGSEYAESRLSRSTSAPDFADQAEDLEFRSGGIGDFVIAELGEDVAVVKKCLDKKEVCGLALAVPHYLFVLLCAHPHR